MTATAPEPPPDRLRLAVEAASAGYRIFPLKPSTKEPATLHGFKDATSDVEQVEAWWAENPEYNIGLACGMQDNGLYIGVIDVDAKHGGVLAWKQLCRDNGGAWQKYMPIHRTPRQGFHIIGQVDPELALNASNGFPRGIDTRGAGGYVVLPDSVFIDTETGEIASYVCTANNLWSTEPGAFPTWVITMWRAGVQRLATGPHPSAQDPGGDSPLSWMKAGIDWYAELERDGFTIEADYGGEVRWTRPGKTRGTSLSLHLDGNGCVVVWSDNCPEWMVNRSCGQPTSDGHWSLNGFQYICARDYGGDIREAMAHIRREMMPPPPSAAPKPRVEEDDEAENNQSGLIHPPGFWTQLPLLEHIRDAAWSMGACPDAQLMAWLTHYATAIPPGYLIPAMVGDESSFDLLTVLVGPSGVKKSSTMRRAEHLTPLRWREDLQLGLDISSGEGIIDAYYDFIPEDDGDPKSKKVRKRAYKAINFKVDEGKVISDLNQRQGTTHTSRLCTAFSGGTLSTPNATTERKRHIDAFTYRLTATIAAQEKYAVAFLTGDSALQGFSQRLLWAWCIDPTKPDPDNRPAEPGPLGPLAVIPPVVGMGVTMRYSAEMVSEVMWADHEVRYRDPLDAHRMLLVVKVAGILALAQGRADVGDLDWAIAHQVVDMSVAVRSHLLVTAGRTSEQEFSYNARRRGAASVIEATEREHRLLGATVDAVAAKLKERDMDRGELRRYITKSKREYLDAALDLLVTMGKIAGGNGAKWHWV